MARVCKLAMTQIIIGIGFRIGHDIDLVMGQSKTHQFMAVESMVAGVATGRAILASMRARVVPEHGSLRT